MSRVTQAHIDARTKEILDAASRMFARKGVEGTTMQEIAAEAGLSSGAIYRYFASKEQLLRAVFADCTEQNRGTFAQASAMEATPLAALLAVGQQAWGKMRDEGHPQQMMMNLELTLAAARDPEVLGVERRRFFLALIDMVEGLVLEAQQAGEIDRSIEARPLAITLLAAHAGSELFALQLGGAIDGDAVFGVVTQVLRRLAPEHAGS